MRIKCPHCNGKGFSELNSALNMTCGWCMGQGELDLEIIPTEPQTEQEYLQTCSIEQLAEKLWEIYDAGKDDAKTYDTFEYFIDKEDVVEWLKQPHTEKE